MNLATTARVLLLAAACLGVSPTVFALGDRPASNEASFSIYMLSRGQGVPEQTREVFELVKTILEKRKEEGHVLETVQTRIGLEGETRLCARCEDVQVAESLYREISKVIEGIELINLKVEACSQE